MFTPLCIHNLTTRRIICGHSPRSSTNSWRNNRDYWGNNKNNFSFSRHNLCKSSKIFSRKSFFFKSVKATKSNVRTEQKTSPTDEQSPACSWTSTSACPRPRLPATGNESLQLAAVGSWQRSRHHAPARKRAYGPTASSSRKSESSSTVLNML